MQHEWKKYFSAAYRRQQMAIGGGLILLISVCAILMEDPAPPPALPPVSHAETSVTEVRGLSAAARRSALRDPFTAAHETERAVNAAPRAVASRERNVPPQTVPAASPVQLQEVSAEAKTALVLCGVVTGADGRRIAIVAAGKDSAALAAGDTWHGYTLDALTDRAATLRTAHGVVTLTRE